MKSGDVITLKGVSQKGKNRVREHGNPWVIIKLDQDEEEMLVVPLPQKDDPRGYWRWVKIQRDQHLEVIAND